MKKIIDQILPQLNKDGIRENQLIQNFDHYKNCAYCFESISRQKPPTLFNCGHIICADCSAGRFCTPCNMNVGIKSTNYTLILDYLEATAPDYTDSKFHFNIRQLSTGRAQLFFDIPAETTIRELLSRSVDFSNFLQAVKDATGFILCNKGVRYCDYKDKTIAEIARGKQIKLVPSSTNRNNELIFYNYQKGGLQE